MNPADRTQKATQLFFGVAIGWLAVKIAWGLFLHVL
jgi:hypothetical protein